MGSAEALPVEADIADFVFAFDSLDHWADRDRGLAEVRRVLREAGVLALVKDGGVPGEAEAVAGLSRELGHAGFRVIEERQVEKCDVLFTLWICEFLRG